VDRARGQALTNARLFAAVGIAAMAVGAALWRLGPPAGRPPQAEVPVPAISAPALYAATFTGPSGEPRSLGAFQGKVLVLNFWATWCEPCRAEMPAFERLQQRWGPRGVQFLGLSDEPTDKAQQFGRALGVGYPLWTGGDQVSMLSRRLGNTLGGLPHTVVVDRKGEVVVQKVGPYTESALEIILAELVGKGA
jgi:thiol-disulfide isomerase/thioredoxin